MLLEHDVPANSEPGRNLIAEANHRIANNLSAISGLVAVRLSALERSRERASPEQARDILDEVKTRIDAVARVHRMVSETTSHSGLDVGLYLQQVATDLVRSLAAPDAVRLGFACELGCKASPERTLHLGVMVLELITNSIKYAHPSGVAGTITLSCRKGSGAIVVDVADDGVGLPDGFDPMSGSHSGLRLVNSLARQMGGRVDIWPHALGMRTEITVPILSVV